MNPDEASRREDLLASLLAQYDGELADDTERAERDASVGDLGAELDGDLANELRAAESCLDLLDRVRRRWTPSRLGEAGGWQAPRTLGRFKIERELGRGGLGIVYLATDPQLARKVAIKTPRFDVVANHEVRRRFLREAEAAARLSHPHLVTLHEVGEDGGICYLACEYCPGPTLAAWLQQRMVPVGDRQAATIALRLAEAVDHAHGRGVLHRDIKPSNVLLAEIAQDGDKLLKGEHLEVSPKLTDFGMAKLLEQEGGETRTGEIIGTVAYMSPEQAEGRVDEFDVRTDVYSLGAILYEMLLGAAPYAGKSDVDTLRQLVTSEPLAPRRIRPDVPRDLEAITLRCLAKRPSDRYATAHELAADLRRFLSHEPTVARPLTPWQIAAKWARRRPAVAALATLSVVSAAILLAGGALYTVRLRQHTEELRQAVTAREEAVTAREEALTAARIHEDEARRSYPRDMRLAQQVWSNGRTGEAITLLEKHRPQPAMPDYRSFAWHYLHSLCQDAGRPLTGHSGPVYVCRYSPDGRLLATGGEDGQVRIWNSAVGTLEGSWAAHDRGINSISFSPDSRWLATTSEDAGAVWEVAAGMLVRRLEIGDGIVHALTFTPDGRTLVVGGSVAYLELLDTADWSGRGQMTSDAKPIRMLAVSADGTMLASTSDDASIRLWDLSNRRPTATLEGHNRTVTAIAFSHLGKTLASASEDGRVKLWNAAELREQATLESHRGHVHDVAFTPDDRWVVSAEDDGRAQLWETGSGKPGRAVWSNNSRLFTVAISPDGREIATGGDDNVVRIWNAAAEPGMIRVADNDPGRAVDISPDSRVVALGDYSGNVRLYSMATHELLKQCKVHGDHQIHDVRFSNSGELLATAGGDNTIRLWRCPDLTLLHMLEGHQHRVWNVAISADSRLVASSSEDRTVKIWDACSGALLHNLVPSAITREVAFSPDGQFLAAGCRDGKVHVWHVRDGSILAILEGHHDDADCVAWSPDGRLLATGGRDEFIFLWDIQRSVPADRISANQGSIKTLAFSPDGRTLASSGMKRTIKLWDVSSREELLTLEGLSRIVSKVGFAEYGDLLYSLSIGKPCDLFFWPARSEDSSRYPLRHPTSCSRRTSADFPSNRSLRCRGTFPFRICTIAVCLTRPERRAWSASSRIHFMSDASANCHWAVSLDAPRV